MSSAKKFKDDYPLDSGPEDKTVNLENKRLIEAYQKKIQRLLEDDPVMQQKAAQIISQLINSSKK